MNVAAKANSNTTLVKVKLQLFSDGYQARLNSNTTLVKVKYYFRYIVFIKIKFKYNTC